MSGYSVTLDAGTTNTRAFLWTKDARLVGAQKREVGVRDTAADGNNARLRDAVRGCLDALLRDAGLDWTDVDKVLASGMITSNVGLFELPHLAAPVSPDDLARGARAVLLEDVCPLPITFIPGVKNSADPVTADNFEAMDIMRGEEVETFALLEKLGADGGRLIVLPGSHTKFVSVDDDGRITGCLTSVTGELLSAVTRHTILADAVARGFVRDGEYSREWTLRGYDTAERVGLGRACFSARILSQLGGEAPARLANYLAGACLQSDVAAVRASRALRIGNPRGAVVAGGGPLCWAMADVLRHAALFPEVRAFVSGPDAPLSGLGALAIARRMTETR